MKRANFILAMSIRIYMTIDSPVWGQSTIVPDATLGTNNSTTQDLTIRNLPSTLIQGGTIQGSNLFHSFLRFNVPVGRGAYFANPDGIKNIFSRVTGAEGSEIFGRLGVLGDANLFLMNPKGILFGQTGSLDVNGSFVATTANAIQFGNDSFSATKPQTVSDPLRVDPSAFLFSQLPVSTITVNSNAPISPGSPFLGLRVPDGQNLILLGGDVNLEGGNLNALGGKVEIGAISGVGVVGLNSDNSLQLPEQLSRSDITVKNSEIDVTAANSGDITISGKNVHIARSRLFAGAFNSNGSLNIQRSDVGDLAIDANELRVEDSSTIANAVYENESGNAGDLIVKTGSLVLTNNSQIIAGTFGQGNTGKLSIQVEGQAIIDNSSISNFISRTGEGSVGDVEFFAGSLELRNNAQLATTTFGRGDSGDIKIAITGNLVLLGSNISNAVGTAGIGRGGNITVLANSLELRDGAQISVNTRGRGDAGNIALQALRILLSRGEIFSSIDRDGQGRGGDISIATNSLELVDGGRLVSRSSGLGNGGNITISARNNIMIDGFSSDNRFLSSIISNVSETGFGKGGNIRIAAGNSLQLISGGQLIATTQGRGDGGEILIDVRDIIRIVGSDSSSRFVSRISTNTDSEGNGGNILIRTSALQIADGGQFDAITFGRGDGGNIFVDVLNSLELLNGGILSTTTVSDGQTGKVTINAGDRILISGRDRSGNPSQLAINFTPSSSAGEITLNTRNLTLDNQGEIKVSAPSGDGGNLKFKIADTLLLRRGSKISAEAGSESQAGNGGNIDIAARFLIAIPQEDSNISANAFRGSGGKVNIFTSGGLLGIEPRLRPTNLSDITASSEVGISGTIILNTPDTNNLQNNLTQLLPSEINTDTLLSNSCIVRDRQNGRFYVVGKSGLPTDPGSLSTYPTGKIQAVQSSQTSSEIVEPQGVYQLADGQYIMSRECQ